MRDDVAIRAESVSKKFCRSLNRSMLYGVQDIACDTLGMRIAPDRLRKDEFWAVNDVSFEIRRGECFGVTGPNGAGKSTLLKMLNGLILPDKGKITIRGRVGALIEVGAGFHPMLTGRENIYISGSILGLSKKKIDQMFDEIVAFAELEEFIDSPVKFYSSGMYVRLGFAVAVHSDPDIMLVDEVLAVGDIFFQHKCYKKINQLRSKGCTIFFASHDMSAIKALCQQALLLQRGIRVAQGLPRDIADLYQRMRFEVPPELVKPASDYPHRSEKVLEPSSLGITFPLTDEEFYNQIKGKEYGTREAIIANACVCSKDGNFKNEFFFNEEIIIRVKLLAMNDIQSYVLGFLLRDRNGMNLLGINTYEENIKIIPLKTYNQLLVEFSTKLPFLNGTYSIALGLSYDETGEKFLHWIDHASVIHIHKPLMTIHGAVYIPTNIELRLL